MVANTATDAWKRVVCFEESKGFLIFSFVHKGDIPLDTNVRRTCRFAGGGSPFADGKGTWDGLIVLFKNGFSCGETFIIVIGKINGAYFDTIAAAGAF
jgi:hypothetical protein